MDPQQLSALTQQIMDRVFIRLEASGRHVHLTREQALTLFGHDLTPERPLSQPGQFLAKERVTLVGPKGKFSNVAVLGPARSAAQAEISLTDSNGALTLEHIDCTVLTLRTTNGTVNAYELSERVEFVDVETSNSSVMGSIYGDQSEFSIDAETTNSRSNLSAQTGGKRTLNVQTTNGTIKFDFIS